MKNIDKMLLKQSKAQETMNYMRSQNAHIFSEWETRTLVNKGNTLQFNIQTEIEVSVIYNNVSQKYVISFSKLINKRNKVIKKVYDVNTEDIISTINNTIGDLK
jgi:uncharacterized protein with HEPN domain